MGANNKKINSIEKKKYIPCHLKKDEKGIPTQFWHAFNEGKYYRASKILEDFLKKHPHHFEAKLRLGEVYCLSERLEKATEVANSLYAQAPQDYNVLMLLGDIHYKQGDFKKAAFYYEAALPKDIDYQTRLSLSNVYFNGISFQRFTVYWMQSIRAFRRSLHRRRQTKGSPKSSKASLKNKPL